MTIKIGIQRAVEKDSKWSIKWNVGIDMIMLGLAPVTFVDWKTIHTVMHMG